MKKQQPQHKNLQPQTLAIRSGIKSGTFQEHSDPIYMTSSFCFKSAQEAAQRFADKEPGYIYSRFSNPSIDLFQDRLAALESAEACVATASGMAAVLATCISLLEKGDEIIASSDLFGSSIALFDKYMRKFGIAVKYVAGSDMQAWQRAIGKQSKLLFVETPSNPCINLVDISALAALAKLHNCILVVDNCFSTPVLQQPLNLGADIVVHSATKYIDGQGRAIGGAVLGSQQLVGEKVFGFLRTAGVSMSPFNAWIFAKGLETLALRMSAHSKNAQLLANYLSTRPEVRQVNYPGLPSHPQHLLAKKQMHDFGGIVSFELYGGQKAAWQLIDNTNLISITANLGDAKTTITHPASTTHARLSEKQRQAANIGAGLLRISVGLEHIDDIIDDLRFS